MFSEAEEKIFEQNLTKTTTKRQYTTDTQIKAEADQKGTFYKEKTAKKV